MSTVTSVSSTYLLVAYIVMCSMLNFCRLSFPGSEVMAPKYIVSSFIKMYNTS